MIQKKIYQKNRLTIFNKRPKGAYFLYNITMNILKIKGLNYKNLLRDINLEVNEGEFISLVGSNGSGKTTLAMLLAGLLEEDIEGIELQKKPAMVFENPDNQIIGTTVEDDIAFGLQNLQMKREDIHSRIGEVLKQVGISELRYRDIHTLSGGQKQRVALAALLALDYEFYILDEVTSMLDPESKKNVLDLIIELNKQGKTIIQITHFIEELDLTPRTIVMNDATIVFDGETKDLLSNDKLLKQNRLI